MSLFQIMPLEGLVDSDRQHWMIMRLESLVDSDRRYWIIMMDIEDWFIRFRANFSLYEFTVMLLEWIIQTIINMPYGIFLTFPLIIQGLIFALGATPECVVQEEVNYQEWLKAAVVWEWVLLAKNPKMVGIVNIAIMACYAAWQIFGVGIIFLTETFALCKEDEPMLNFAMVYMIWTMMRMVYYVLLTDSIGKELCLFF